MARISDLLLLPPPSNDDGDEEDGDDNDDDEHHHINHDHQHDDVETLNSQTSPLINLHRPSIRFFLSDDDDDDQPISSRHVTDVSDSISTDDSRSDFFFDDDDDIHTIALDLFDRTSSHRNPSNRNTDRNFDHNPQLGSNFLELGLGYGAGDCSSANDGKADAFDGFIAGESQDDPFFFGNSESVSSRSSVICAFGGDDDAFRVDVGFESDSESNDVRIAPIELDSEGDNAPDRATNTAAASDDIGLIPLCWDCLHLEDRRDAVEDFEWEEVDRRSAVDEHDAVNMEIETAINSAFDASMAREQSVQEINISASANATEGVIRSLDWEVLLAVNNLENPERNFSAEQDTESYFVDHDDYIYTTEYEVLFGQFAEAENSLRGSPPAAKAVVENLHSVYLTKEDVENNNASCAVCKDEISLDEKAKRLPCTHHYHGDCILPWLGLRNTCPVCRFELPTDDLDYERWRRQRASQSEGII